MFSLSSYNLFIATVMIVSVLILIALALLYKYHQQTRQWKIFQQRGIPYAEPTWPLGSAHMWRVVFCSDATFPEMFRTYLGSNLEKGDPFLLLLAFFKLSALKF